MDNKLYCGLDFHKNISEFCIMDQFGKVIERGRLSNEKFLLLFSNKPSCVIGVESTGGVFDIVDKLKRSGHKVTIINSVKFRGIGIGGKKNDRNDAEALANALRLNFVPEVFQKNLYSRRLKSLLSNRDFVVRTRTALISHIRGILREYGQVLPKGKSVFEKNIQELLCTLDCDVLKDSLSGLVDQVMHLNDQQLRVEKALDLLTMEDIRIKRLQTVPGIGKLGAMAFVATIEDPTRFTRTKHLGSYLGIIPKEMSSGTKKRYGSITRCGPEMVRRYLIHGARSILTLRSGERDQVLTWAHKLKERSTTNKAVVALAHKNARICLALMRDGVEYKSSLSKKVA